MVIGSRLLFQRFKKRCEMGGLCGDDPKNFRRGQHFQRFEPADGGRTDLKEGVPRAQFAFPRYVHVDGGGLRAFKVSASLQVCVHVAQISPERGTRCEKVPPTPAYMG